MCKKLHLARRVVGLAGLVFAAGACRSVAAPDPFETLERSSFFVSTQTAPAGVLEAELAAAWKPGDTLATVATVNYGWTDATEWSLEWVPFAEVDRPGRDARGAGDLTVAATTRFRDQDGPGPSVAVSLAAKLPVGDDDPDLGSGEVDVGAELVASRAFEGWYASAFATLDLLGEPGASGVDAEPGGGLALAWSPCPRVAAFAALEGSYAAEESRGAAAVFVGSALALTNRWLVELGVRLPVTGEEAGAELALGVLGSF